MSDDPDQSEKLRVFHEAAGTALNKLVNLTSPKPGGRYATPQARLVADAEAKVAHAPHHPHAGHHPQSPYGSAWPNPLEPALGYSINRMEPCGTPAEIAASIEALQPPLASPVAAGGEARIVSDEASGPRFPSAAEAAALQSSACSAAETGEDQSPSPNSPTPTATSTPSDGRVGVGSSRIRRV